MDIIIQSLGFPTGESLENYIREKLEKFDDWHNIVRAHVTLFIGPESEPNNNYCEIRLEVPGKDQFIKRSSDSFERAITDAVNTLQHNLKKAKEKQIDQRHPSS
jgi:putative sigma-54 modulation protein